jgi:hypothetical protein
MKLQRSLGNLGNLGNLQTGESLPWYTRLLRPYMTATPASVPMELRGETESSLVLRPTLLGKVFRPNLSRLYPEQVQRLRGLLRKNIDVGMLAGAFAGDITELGVLSTRLITNTGVLFLAAAFAGVATISNMKYHGFGTGTAAEGVAQTALQTEFTTEYAVDSTRPTGSQSNTVVMPAVYTTVGTFSPDSGGTLAVTEHGIFSGASGANTMWDRSVFAAVNLVAGSDSLQVTYNLTLTAGG